MAVRDLVAKFVAKDEMSDEIERIRSNLNRLERQYHETDRAAEQATGGADSFAASMTRVGIGVTAGGTALAALAQRAYALGTAFDEVADTIQIRTGTTGAALEALQEDFAAVVRDVPTDFGRATAAIAGLQQRLELTGEELRARSAQLLELSRLTGTDVSENVRLAARAFQDWSIATEDQAATLDKFFRASQMSGASVQELMQQVVMFGAPARQLGLEFDEMVALLARFEKEGVNTEQVMTTLRQALMNLAQAGIDPKEGFRDLLVTIRDMPSELEATQLAMAAFGARGGADMAAAIREGRFEIDAMRESLQDAAGAIRQTGADTDDGAQRMQKALAEVALAFKPLGTAAFQAATDVAEAFARMVTHISDRRNEMLPILDTLKQAMALSPAGLLGQAAGMAAGAAGLGPKPTPGLNTRDALDQEFGADLRAAAEEVADDAAAAGAKVGGSFNQGLIDALTGKGGGAQGGRERIEREAREIMERAAESSIAGFMSAISQRRTDLADLVGDISASAAVALETAFREQTTASGAAVGREIENLIDQLRKAGLPNWRELGDDYANTFRVALLEGTAETKMDALAALVEISGLIEAARSEAKRAASEAKLNERLAEIDATLTERRTEIELNAREAIAEAEAALRLARETQTRRDELSGRHRSELDALQARFRSEDRLGDRADLLRRAAQDVNAARFGGNSLEILAAMTRQQEMVDRLVKDDAAFNVRIAREEELRNLRLQQEREVAALRITLEDEALQRQRGRIGTNAARDLARAEDAAGRDVARTINQYITVNNYGAIGEDAIQDLGQAVFDEAELFINQIG